MQESIDKLQRIIRSYVDFYMHTPRERYNNMCKRYPDIIQRVPQYHIASYLNVSTVHLSRLKRQR